MRIVVPSDGKVHSLNLPKGAHPKARVEQMRSKPWVWLAAALTTGSLVALAVTMFDFSWGRLVSFFAPVA